ncbi:GNAT family N-acetyltransferase [Acinetobacter vivianii]|uniref:GNAT family N-acetyltransferase n=1 Tax=Acinetobacter vivianii TaxID=1776742 RepID=A0AAJ6P5T5_9GAMM|nr:GNAT family N-acetyltransferase [Acinetobacter vivianii]WDZ51800.1 GNAT family N-acetyltransferase [Acinetobacter vivianii]
MFRIENGSWSQLGQDAKLIRTLVFMTEQNISEQDEWDDQDEISQHFVVYHQDQAIATARLLQDHSVGRVAVKKEYRGQGIGLLIMLDIIVFAQQQCRPFLQLSSQVHAISFYEKLGFIVKGSEYNECGIPHIEMMRPIMEPI